MGVTSAKNEKWSGCLTSMRRNPASTVLPFAQALAGPAYRSSTQTLASDTEQTMVMVARGGGGGGVEAQPQAETTSKPRSVRRDMAGFSGGARRGSQRLLLPRVVPPAPTSVPAT